MIKRRTPPLFEVLSVPDRNPGPLMGGLGRRPIQTSSPPSRPQPTRSGTGDRDDGGPARGVQIPTAAIFLSIALLLLVGFAVWYFAFELGKQHKKDQLQPYLSEVSVSSPLPPTGPVTTAPTSTPPVAAAAVPDAPPAQPTPLAGADPRRQGVNYLHVVTLNWKEAERAAEFLTRSGVPAGVAPAKKAIDVQAAKAKNLPLLVVVLEGIPSDQFRTSEGKRRELVEKVRRIGKKWQSEEHGPSDFGEPYWAKFE